MDYKIVIKTLAEQDIKEAAEWYNKNAPHVLVGFLTELKNSISLLQQNPQHFQKRYNEVRVIFIRTFPFSLYYTIENKIIFVHAVLHTRRDPKTGAERIL